VLGAAEANGPREGALLKTVYYLALRATEAANLRRDDFSPRRGTLTVGVLKRSKRERRPDGTRSDPKPPPRVACALDSYMVERLVEHTTELDAAGVRSEWLFPPPRQNKRAPSRWDVLTAYHRAAKQAALGETLQRHPHVLRHTRAMQHLAQMAEAARAAGKTLHSLEMVKELQKVLRHASEDTCMSYIHETEAGAEFSAAATASIGRMLAGIKGR
jgi:integrase